VTISELGSIGEIIGAAATVATLLYLAIQIRSNTLVTKSESLRDIIDRVIQWEARLVDSPELLHSWTEGSKSYHNLKDEDQIRFTTLSHEILSACETSWEAAKFGGIKAETLEAARGIIYQLMRNKGVQEYWEVSGSITMAVDFVKEVDAILKTSKTADPRDRGPLPFYMPVEERR
jgi:hypothetical protein